VLEQIRQLLLLAVGPELRNWLASSSRSVSLAFVLELIYRPCSGGLVDQLLLKSLQFTLGKVINVEVLVDIRQPGNADRGTALSDAAF
jgi:hypothetical protein